MNTLNSKTLLALIVSTTLLSGCGDSSDDSVDASTPDDTVATFNVVTLDAATNTSEAALLDLLSGSTVTDETWQVAYQKSVGFKLNGGSSGDGEVSACIAHQYTDLFDDNGDAVESSFEALTASSTLTDFNRVDSTYCTDFEFDEIETEIDTDDWLDYNATTHTISAKEGNGWIVRSADGDSYARVKVDSLSSTTAVFSNQLWNGSVFESAVNSPDLDLSSGSVYWDLETNSIVTESDDWDLRIVVDGFDYSIQVNGGVSGNGDAGVAYIFVNDVDDVTDPTSKSEVYDYFVDSASGTLSSPGNYGPLQYNVGGAHKMWPTFTTYLIKDEAITGSSLFKVQVISNYGEQGDLASANVVFRYEELTD